MNGQPKDPVDAAAEGRPLLEVVDGQTPGAKTLAVKGADEMVARLDCYSEPVHNNGWAKALANRWNIYHDLVDGLRELAMAAQAFSGGRRSPTGALETGLANARRLLDRADGRAPKKAPAGLERIISTPGTMGGKPCVRGTRLAVEHVLGMVAAGDSVEEILGAYPQLVREDVLACVAYGAWAVREPASAAGLVITVEPGANPDDVGRAVKETVGRRLEEIERQTAPLGAAALYQPDPAQVRDLLWEVAHFLRALPQRYQPGDDKAEWEREFSGEPFSVPDVTLLLRFAVERAKAEAEDESAAAALDKGIAELILDLPGHLKAEDAEQKVRSGKPTDLVVALAQVMVRVRKEWGWTPGAVKVVPLWCTHCGAVHVDEGEWASRIHREHRCASCGGRWRIDPPAIGAQVTPDSPARQHLASADIMEATAGMRIRCDQGDKLVVDLRTFQVRELGLDVATDEEIAALGGKIPDTEHGRAALQALRTRKADDRKDELIKMAVAMLRQVAEGKGEPHPAMLSQVAEGLESMATELPALRQRLVAAEDRAGKAEARASKGEAEATRWWLSSDCFGR